MKILESLVLTPKTLWTDMEILSMERKKMPLIIDHMKKEYKMSRWIHMPRTSEEYQFYKTLCVEYEVFA